MFFGVNTLNMDAKGRMAVPVKYRKSLGADDASSVFVTVNPRERCLWLFPENEWQDIVYKVTKLPSSRQNTNFRRMLLGYTNQLNLDSQGRILLHSNLREWAGLSKRVAFVGQGQKFEIWDADVWHVNCEQWFDDNNQADGEMSPELASLAL